MSLEVLKQEKKEPALMERTAYDTLKETIGSALGQFNILGFAVKKQFEDFTDDPVILGEMRTILELFDKVHDTLYEAEEISKNMLLAECSQCKQLVNFNEGITIGTNGKCRDCAGNLQSLA